MPDSLRKLTFLDLVGCRWAYERPSIWEVQEVIASAEAFALRGSSGVATLLLLTLATAVPVSGSALALPGSSGAATKFRVEKWWATVNIGECFR